MRGRRGRAEIYILMKKEFKDVKLNIMYAQIFGKRAAETIYTKVLRVITTLIYGVDGVSPFMV